MPTITPAQLIELQKKQTGIRNICILAHVDHGKTTLSDSLLASNGIISSKLSGKVRYLDSREDEQQRGITMKSSGISLFFRILQQAAGGQDTVTEDYLINLIDSPGHVDFSSEVSTASRLCDGALVLVDAVEGVCTQTHTVLRQAWQESVRPILVLNKVDRLITELKLSPTEAYTHMNKILEQVNAIMGTFHNENMMEADAARYEAHKARQQARGDDQEGGDEGLEWQLQQQDDSNLYFSPELGNVLFASAIDGWAFRTKQFAQIYAAKLGIREELLKRFLWGDFYLDPKTKRVVGSKGLKGRNLKPLFVQFILDNLWAVYDAVMNSNASEREKVEKIVKALSIKVLPRDMKSKDNRYLLQIIMSQWLSLSSSVLLTVVDKLPNPIEAQQLRMPKILQVTGGVSTLRGNEEFEKLEKALRDCDAGEDAPTVAYVSKMFSVPADMLPSNRRVQLSAEEMRERRREALRRQQEGAAGKAAGEGKLDNQTSPPITLKDDEGNPVSTPPTDAPTEPATKPPTGDALVGFARIYSGTIKTGQTIHVLGPKFDPAHPDRYRTEVKVDKLYLMMGRELQALEEVPAGNIFAIGGLEDVVLKTGTLSSVRECVSFGGLRMEAPIVRVAVEPRDPSEFGFLDLILRCDEGVLKMEWLI
ncbi:Cytoplasmic GTPase/eEF2-like protein (ribosomal biogenesis) [Rhizophlyctis rosea]|uniref:Cytoplasmic GTPase/eEF2-like protein (Ribosomal biogenesis) n=1 Tax=Rhizophlyctis rosea TaxID=64517 RepID=A0AAD5SB77_9FUNG|nr:Cytoplasmic GTPase/eEF2-like protein (ribosomal biogenesis) [Rhizophlyctis rosea]